MTLAVEVRHRGQGEAITVGLGGRLPDEPARQVEAAFEDAYRGLYERRPSGVDAEVIAWRVRVSGPRPALAANGSAPARRRTGEAAQRPIWSLERDEMVDATVAHRDDLAPAVLE